MKQDAGRDRTDPTERAGVGAVLTLARIVQAGHTERAGVNHNPTLAGIAREEPARKDKEHDAGRAQEQGA